jgi:hypothetical protein
MIEIAGGILLAVLILVFLPYIIAAVVYVGAAALLIGGLALVVWLVSGIPQEEWLALAVLAAAIVALFCCAYVWKRRRSFVRAWRLRHLLVGGRKQIVNTGMDETIKPSPEGFEAHAASLCRSMSEKHHRPRKDAGLISTTLLRRD